MTLEHINDNISRLIEMRKQTHNNIEWQKIINIQLDKLYEFKYELMKGVAND